MTPGTLVEILQRRAAEGPDRGFRYVVDGDREEIALSFQQLDAQARALAALLQSEGLQNERVLLMYPPGLEFIAAFFGCLYAGAVPVPVYPPDPGRLEATLPRLAAIVRDADARALLTTSAIQAMAAHILPTAAPAVTELAWLASDDVDPAFASSWQPPAITTETLAFLQYTSGSTASPKGVMVSHGNLLHNQEQIRRAFDHDASLIAVCWLPLFHDMGLIGSVLQPVYTGTTCVMMSPLAFLQRPARWLEAVTRHRATTSGGPNFAYDLCVRKVTDAERAGLDLSSWKVAYNGAEPVRRETLERFAQRFGASGFRREAFYPCYGLAEGTLFVTGGRHDEAPRTLAVGAHALDAGRAAEPQPDEPARHLVSSGAAWVGQTVAVVSSETKLRCADGDVGEIWVKGPSVARGYWGREAETARAFQASLADSGDGPYLRTGDLGLIRDGELYVTGRIKDVIIVRGRNRYPHDLEATVERSAALIRRGCCAAFAVDQDGEERLVIAAEVDARRGTVDVDALGVAVRDAIATEHAVRLATLVLLRAGSIPKTSSGKLQRHACREGYLQNTLAELARWPTVTPLRARRTAPPVQLTSAQAVLVARLQGALSRVLNGATPPGPTDSLDRLGLDSLAVVELKAQIEQDVGAPVPLALLREVRTLADLAVYLQRQLDARAAEAATHGGAADEAGGDPWSAHVNPHVARLLRAFRLDKRYVRGEGCYAVDAAGRRYLDFTAAYGALPFGFNPPEIWCAIHDAARAMPANLAQPSLLDAAGRLARRLVEIAPRGLRYVAFANSGAEAMEAAIKLARAATGRRGIVSMDRAFHGKTLGALSATGRAAHQSAFGAPAPGFSRVPYGDLAALGDVLARDAADVAAVVVEPVQGEGGIHVAPAGYLAGVRALCDRHDVLLVLDEVQTGLGRTGALFGCEHDGVVPDVVALAKALGGGLVPVGAVLYNAAAYSEAFALRHSSTFAGNALAALVGLRTLEVLTRDDHALVRHVAQTGAVLHAGLVALQRKYPGIIREVRGRGYMLGLELTTSHAGFARQCMMGAMAEQETLSLALCSYLLNVEGVRLAPTLLGTRVLRVEPPLVATRAECDEFLAALDRALAVLASCDTERFLGHLVDHVPRERASAPAIRAAASPALEAGDARWGFVFHPLDHRSYVDFDAGLAPLAPGDVQALVARLGEAPRGELSSALVIGAGRVASPAGASAYGELVAVSATADELLAMPTADAVALVRDAVELARDRGARIVGLGAYSSVVTKNGAYLAGVGVPITTGNSFTVVAAVDVVVRAAQALDIPLAEATVAVVGATGSIGRAVAMELAPRVGRLILAGNPAHPEQALDRLRRVAEDLAAHAVASTASPRGLLAASLIDGRERAPATLAERLLAEGRVVLTAADRPDFSAAAVVVTATSSTRTLVQPEQVGPGAIVCDVSQPANVSPRLASERPDVLVLEGGVVGVPGQREFGVAFGLAPGLLYACMAETALLALDERFRDGSIGRDLAPAFIADLRDLAARHGLHVVPARGGTRLTDEDWARAADARRAALAPTLPRVTG